MTEPEKVRSVSDMLDALSVNTAPFGERWYRGHRDELWNLLPSVNRRDTFADNEYAMLQRFRQLATARAVNIPSDQWGWVMLAQHHRLPTRLLDWSQNPLIGLFFAVEEPADPTTDTDGELFALDPVGLNRRSWPECDRPWMLSGHEKEIAPYLPGEPDPTYRRPAAVIAPHAFDRIVSQSGTFALFPQNSSPDLTLDTFEGISSWIIPVEDKPKIRLELRLLGISASTVYPDLDHISDHIRADYES